MPAIQLIKDDCLKAMRNIKDGSIDMILCDLPYGKTNNYWDKIIPSEPLWEQYKRVIKENGAVVLFAQQPFAARLIMSNLKQYRYEWIWEKSMGTGFLNSNRMPLKKHENILVFYKKLPVYNPQKTKGIPYTRSGEDKSSDNYNKFRGMPSVNKDGMRYPVDILRFPQPICSGEKIYHPTQKPVELLKYLISTYTNEGGTVLDNCMGSGSTGVACIDLNRNFIGIELDDGYFQTAESRINAHLKKQKAADTEI